MSRFRRLIMVVAGSALFAAVAPAQTPAPAAPPAAAAPAPVPAPPAAAEPPASADASSGQEVVLEARPTLSLRGEATWDDGYEALTKAFDTLKAEARRLGLTVTRPPQAAFHETNDLNFKYEAMVLLDAEPDATVKPRGGIAIARSPAGKSFVFKHVGAYDDIDSIYEAITAWLDEKGLEAKGAFIEEYVNAPTGSDDSKLELNIYVFVK